MVILHYDLISLHYSVGGIQLVSHIVSLISFYGFASYLIRSLNGIQMNLAAGRVALGAQGWIPDSDPVPCNYLDLFAVSVATCCFITNAK